MNDDEIRWLTYGAIRHRPHGAPRWQETGTAAAIRDHCGGWNLPEATAHVLAHARDPKAETPAAIRARWTPDNEPTIGGPPKPPRRDQECATHAGHHAHNCSGCAADQLADDGQNATENGEVVTHGTGWDAYRDSRKAMKA